MKVLIIGIVASGKTTLAKRLSQQTGLIHYEIDSIVHDDIHHRKRTVEEQKQLIKEIDSNNDWIIEGTLRKNLYYLLELADKIIYLDIPLKIRKRRIITRFIKQKLRIEKCNYKSTFKMLKLMFQWTKDFENNKIELEEYLSNFHNKVVILKDIKKINTYQID